MKAALERLYAQFNHADAATDPIQIVRRYRRKDDREIVGFCAAALAFGRVASLMASIERLVGAMGPSPAAFVRRFDPGHDGVPLRAMGHRWTRGDDLVALLWVLRAMLDEHGSIERFFLKGYERDAEDVGPALESFSTRARAVDVRPAYGPKRRLSRGPGVAYFFPAPSAGSACKRLNLFLRWMVRADGIDLGVWRGVSPKHLVVPLDTHVIRVGRCLGLTRYTSPGWKMASDITRALREIHRDDPVRYDFSLCHIGMMDQCAFNRPRANDSCPMHGFCRAVQL